MKKISIRIRLILGLSILLLTACNKEQTNDFISELPSDCSRIWIGPDYWANPLQDWQLKEGKIECVTSGGYRNVYLLSREIGSQKGDFSMSIDLENLNLMDDSLGEGWLGFEIGIKGEFHDYRDNAVRARGFPIGISNKGQLFIGKIDPLQKALSGFSFEKFKMTIQAHQQKDGRYILVLEIKNDAFSQRIQRENIPSFWIEGGISIMCHSGALKEFPDKIDFVEYPDWGMVKGTERKGNMRFAFSHWRISGDKIEAMENHCFGPVLFAQYTLSESLLKLSAQMPPIGDKDAQNIELQIFVDNKWKTIQEAAIDPLSRSALFRIEDWNTSENIKYRLAYQLYDEGNKRKEYYYEGLIRKEPIDKEEIVVAAFTGNNDLGFPNNDIIESIQYHNPDLLFFSGDQIYEGVGGYGAQRSPLDKACVDYLRKWYLFGWAYGDILRDRPSITIPDDHDMYHGNIWGAGGRATPKGAWGAAAQDAGGYKMPADWVNMVQRTQTAHLPDAFDSKAVEQGIGVYYCDLQYAGISFAILEDRKFKSAPKVLLPEADIYNGWAQNQQYDIRANSDVKGAQLLGERQIVFLEHWSSDWKEDTWMKVVLSQTIFANVATLPYKDSHSDAIVPRLRIMKKGDYPPNDVVVADFDANSWPQTGRNKALKAIRKSFAFHCAGDQHLGSVIQYGIDEWQDAGYAFCVPSISNVWPRRWYPSEGGKNRLADAPKYTGDFIDGFGNRMSVLAVSNPVYTGQKPAKLYDRATGYGIIRFHKISRNIILECWPRQANPRSDAQYDGWPISINQRDQYLKNAIWFLPQLDIKGAGFPLVQVIDDSTHEIVYTIRINDDYFIPKVPKEGFYSIRVRILGKEKIWHHIAATKVQKDKIAVDFDE